MLREIPSHFYLAVAQESRRGPALVCLLFGLLLGSCGSVPSAAKMNEVVTYLASDELKGRDTGSEGIEKAAEFLEDEFEAYGIAPFFSSFRDTLSNTSTLAYNVVGVIEGSDPRLKGEYILIGAHFDHIGIVPPKDGDEIANGANDNASGTSTVLELARYFGKQKVSKRSLIFAFFSAEEKGLLGSKHLATVLKDSGIHLYTMLNFEMTGVPMQGKDYLLYLTGYEKSNLAEIANTYGGSDLIGFLPKAGEFNLFQRSDNYAFWEVFGVPSHTFSSFDFENYNYYHQPGDEATRMDYEHLSEVVRRMIPVIQGIADSPKDEIKLN
ncbi:MAG: M28 family peptidase [Robiginitalea sp.]|uniref:M28 family metallopeptidase n=1 Tax=Robiginitalea sp. TaxID=1902411 RepID=UPI003C75803A